MKFLITKKQLMLVLCAVLVIAGTVIGSVRIRASTNRKLPIYCVETDKKQIAISFDAAWDNSKKIQNDI